MKIKLSKKQWEDVGVKSGWMKESQLLSNFDEMEIGSTPSGEKCAQLGAKNYDYDRLSRIEAKAFIKQLMRQFPDIPDGARFKIKGNSHDFGTYYEVAIKYDESDNAAYEYAIRVENNTPEYWDDMARAELEQQGYFTELQKGESKQQNGLLDEGEKLRYLDRAESKTKKNLSKKAMGQKPIANQFDTPEEYLEESRKWNDAKDVSDQSKMEQKRDDAITKEEKLRFSGGTTPDNVVKKQALKLTPNGYSMEIKGQSDWKAIATAVNQGIDSHLEGFTRSKFDNKTGKCNIHPEEVHILVRRLLEGDENAQDLRSAILQTLEIEEV